MHTHSIYCDGADTPREMVKTAIEKGFDILGFSGHAYSPYDICSMSAEKTQKYIDDIQSLREEFRDSITIYLGIEEDSTCRIQPKEPFDFVIASVHFFKKNGEFLPVDFTEEAFRTVLEQYFEGNFLRLAENYYSRVAAQKDFEEADIIGHIDLLTKFNEDERYVRFDDPSYLSLVHECITTLGNDRLYEVNTGAIARGYRTAPYPDIHILKLLRGINARLMLNSDCHDRRYLDCGFADALAMIESCGFEELYILKDGKFSPVPIHEFG